MRCLVSFGFVAVLTAVSVPACASSLDAKPADQESIAALEVRIGQAQPREQCYLYAELIHQMTEFSLQQYSAGDTQKASSLLKDVQSIARKLHLSVADNDKRLKNAEILLRHTAFRLNEMLHNSSYEDRPLVEQTLAQVNQADNEAMMQVFKK
jgi:hypothetical protein